MRKLIAAAALLLLLPIVAYAAEGPFTGPATWTWNASQSKTADANAPTKSMVLKITRDDGTNLAWLLTVVDAKGATHKMSWSGAYDGKERPAKGGGGAAAFTKGGDGSIKIAFKEKDGSTGDETCTVSSDRKKMTCNGTVKGKDGRTVDYTDIYDRS
jgi:hypothetical protein